MREAETYKRWIIQTQQVFYVEVWDPNGSHFIAVRNAKSEDDAIELAKKWIDKYEAEAGTVGWLDSFNEAIDSEIEF